MYKKSIKISLTFIGRLKKDVRMKEKTSAVGESDLIVMRAFAERSKRALMILDLL